MKALRQFTGLAHLSLVVHDDTHPVITGDSYVNTEVGGTRWPQVVRA